MIFGLDLLFWHFVFLLSFDLTDLFLLFTNDKSIFLNINFGDEFETLSLFELGKNIILLLILASSESFAIKEQKVDAFDNPPINIKILNNKDKKKVDIPPSSQLDLINILHVMKKRPIFSDNNKKKIKK